MVWLLVVTWIVAGIGGISEALTCFPRAGQFAFLPEGADNGPCHRAGSCCIATVRGQVGGGMKAPETPRGQRTGSELQMDGRTEFRR